MFSAAERNVFKILIYPDNSVFKAARISLLGTEETFFPLAALVKNKEHLATVILLLYQWSITVALWFGTDTPR